MCLQSKQCGFFCLFLLILSLNYPAQAQLNVACQVSLDATEQVKQKFRSEIKIKVDEFFSSSVMQVYKQTLNEQLNRVIVSEQRFIEESLPLNEDLMKTLAGLRLDLRAGKVDFSKLFYSLPARMLEQGLSLNGVLLPGVVFKNKNTAEVKLLNPFLDSLPDLQIWLPVPEMLSLKESEIARAISDGKYPMSGSFHDVFHFLGFVTYPEYMKSVRKLYQNFESHSLSLSKVERGATYLLEIFSLIQVKNLSRLKTALRLEPGLDRPIEYEATYLKLKNMQFKQQVLYARGLIGLLNESIVNYSASLFRPLERHYIEQGQADINTILDNYLRRKNPWDGEIKALPVDYYYDNISLLPAKIEEIIKSVSSLSKDSSSLTEKNKRALGKNSELINDLLVDHITKAEIALWNSQFIKNEDWFLELSSEESSGNSNLGNYIKDVFGEFSRLYQGIKDE